MKTEVRYGKQIKEARLARGWTQEHLAMVADITVRTVARIEKDQVQGPESLMAIAAALETDLKKLAVILRIGEVKPTRSLRIQHADDLQIAFDRAHDSGLYRSLTLPATDAWRDHVEELLETLFIDLRYLSADEPEIVRSWVVAAREPLAELRSMGIAIFTIQDAREVFLGEAGQRRLIEDWTTGYYLAVQEESCYLIDDKLHRFRDGCTEGVRVLLRWLRQEQDGTEMELGLMANPLVAIATYPEEALCKTCFPMGPSEFLTEEYLAQVTGLNPDQLQALLAQVSKEIQNKQNVHRPG